jgi:hypothetical protein
MSKVPVWEPDVLGVPTEQFKHAGPVGAQVGAAAHGSRMWSCCKGRDGLAVPLATRLAGQVDTYRAVHSVTGRVDVLGLGRGVVRPVARAQTRPRRSAKNRNSKMPHPSHMLWIRRKADFRIGK